jgi:hypothetical protein
MQWFQQLDINALYEQINFSKLGHMVTSGSKWDNNKINN